MVEQYAQQHSSLEATLRKEYHLNDPAACDTPSTVIAKNSNNNNHNQRGLSESDREFVSASAKSPVSMASGSDDDDDFHDALADTDEVFTISAPPWGGGAAKASAETLSKKSESSSKEDDGSDIEDLPSHGGNQVKSNHMTNS